MKEGVVESGRIRHTVEMLLLASGVCAVLLLVRCAWTGKTTFSGLLGNLVLAWIPLLRTLALRKMTPGERKPLFRGMVVLWVLFFPNSFYIITDLIHLRKFGGDGMPRWFDSMLTASFAGSGALLGAFSLYLTQMMTEQRAGAKAARWMAGGMLALGAFGIYLGRTLRLNSWDVVARPGKIGEELARLTERPQALEALAFTATFFFISVAIYLCVLSLTRLREAAPEGDERA
jgi:uncharacterized membrane protein